MLLVRVEENCLMDAWKGTDNQLPGLYSIINLLRKIGVTLRTYGH